MKDENGGGKSGVMPERKDGGLCPRAEGFVVDILTSADESDGFGNVSGDDGFGGTVIDHDKRSANYQVVGDLSEKGRWIE